MKQSVHPEPISPEEWLARFVTSKHWVRSSDGTVKPDAFIPPPDLNLSMTRHLGLSEQELWQVGASVVDEIAEKRMARLYGRADLMVERIASPLKAQPAPLPGNPNHAHVTGWPSDKPAQKNLAQRLAAVAQYLALQE